MNGACVGGAIDLASFADIRYCTADAKYSIKEVDVGLVADIGTTARFPKIIGSHSTYAELLLTGRWFFAQEAKEIGFVSKVFDNYQTMQREVQQLAHAIAQKS